MNDNVPRVLVTGASGFIGRRFRQPEHRGLVRGSKYSHHDVCGHLLDPASLARACEGVETVFHCAGYAHAFSSADPDAHWRINYEGTTNLLSAAAAAGVGKFIFLSSVKAMAEPDGECVDEDFPGPPVTSYGKAKRAAEDAVLAVGLKHGIHVVNLRLAMVYGRGGRGNLDRMARGIQGGWFPPLPETGNKRSLVHVDDVVAVMRLVAERAEANGRTYIIADPQPYSGREIYDAIKSVLAQGAVPPAPTFAWRVPAGVLRAGGTVGDLLGALLRRPLPMNSEVVARLLDSAWYSPARIERELGWRAQVGLIDGLREMLGSEASV